MRFRLVLAFGMSLAAASGIHAQTEELPKRRAGLWEMQIENPQIPGKMLSTLQCIDERTDADLQRRAMQGGAQGRCSKTSIRKVGAAYELDVVCNHDRTTMTSHGLVTGDFQNTYQADIQSRFDPPLQGNVRDTTSHVRGRYAGACGQDMKPGDLSVNGVRISVDAAGNPQGIDIGDLKNIKPEDMKRMIEQMKQQMGGG